MRDGIILAVASAVMAAVPLWAGEGFLLHFFILLLLNVTLGTAWNLIGGFAGQLSLGHAAFFGIGAYGATLAHLRWALPGWQGMWLGGALSLLVAAVLGWICFRLKGPYFALATIALAEILRLVAQNWKEVTHGSEGLLILRPLFSSKVQFYYAALLIAFATLSAAALIRHSKWGYYLFAIREDQEAAESLGVNLLGYKLLALLASAFFTALAGSFYAFYIGFIDPASTLTVERSIEMALLAIIGGMGTVFGPAVGAVAITALSEGLRLWFLSAHFFIYGVLVVVVILFMPEGIIGSLGKFWRGKRRAPV
ncbi:MAG: branched-chain amino acid ABC transporter permease [Candidatus Manganitrophaceae bacterium]|nr:MAG: branched-chain amino acid ABC transporter permease [Candidatus Manganitrophaceae bacterium]